MGIVRGGSVLILCVLLLLSLIVMDSFFILGSSLKYDNVEHGISTIVQDISNSGDLIPKELTGNFNVTKAATDVSLLIKYYCQNTNSSEYKFSYEGYNITIPCTQEFLNNPSAIINKSINDVTYEIYYQNYDCNFFDCFSKTNLPFFLVSEKSMNYWMNKFYIMLAVSLVLLFLIFLFVEQKQNTLIIAGVLLILSSFPILKLKDLVSILAGKFSSIINLFLSSTGMVFTLSLVIGGILILAGIILRILGRNVIKQKVSVNDVKNIVKEEISKQSKPVILKQQKKQIVKTKKRR